MPRYRRCTLLLMIAMCFVAACDAAPATPPAPLSPLSGAYSYTPAPAHTLTQRIVAGGVQFPDSLNPLFADIPIDLTLENALWAAPVFFDQQFRVHPDQLTEVPLPENGGVTDGGRTIIMHLRHDLRWSDGQPITSGDFRYWWQVNQNPDTGAITTSGYDQIASIDTPDTYTVVLHVKQPFGSYLSYLPYAAPQHAWGKLSDIDLQNTPAVSALPGITDGPYALSSAASGQSITMIANSYYHSTTFHGPFAARLIYRVYPDLSALAQAARQGAIDAGEGYTESDLPLLRAAGGMAQIIEGASAAYEHLDFNMAQSSLQDARVRRAIQMAINVCGMLANMAGDSGCTRRVSQVEPLPSPVYDASIHPTAFDPAAARALLAQAGWQPNAQGAQEKNGHPLTLHLVTTTNNAERLAIARDIQRDLSAIGVQVTISTYDLSTFFGVYTKGGILATGRYDLALFTYVNGPEPDQEYNVFASSQIPSASNPYGGNYGRVSDPIIDQALTNGRTAAAFNERAADYHRFLERLAAQVYTVPLFTEANIVTIKPGLHNVQSSANLYDNTWNIADWWMG